MLERLRQRLVQGGALPELPPKWRDDFFELTYKNRGLGWVHKSFSPHLDSRYFHLPSFASSAAQQRQQLVLRSDVTQQDITQITRDFHAKKLFTGWRDELYSARALQQDSPQQQPLREEMFYVERAFAKVFGLVRHSIHVNGLVRRREEELKCWMGTRSLSKGRFPGMLDNVVAGGLPRGMSPLECAVKECWEEASIPEPYARAHLRPAGALTRVGLDEKDGRFLALEEIFVFDLDMPSEFTPQPCDGEVARFDLLTLDEILYHEHPHGVKPDVLAVTADLMVRLGLTPPVRTDQDLVAYLELVRALHIPLPRHVNLNQSKI